MIYSHVIQESSKVVSGDNTRAQGNQGSLSSLSIPKSLGYYIKHGNHYGTLISTKDKSTIEKRLKGYTIVYTNIYSVQKEDLVIDDYGNPEII